MTDYMEFFSIISVLIGAVFITKSIFTSWKVYKTVEKSFQKKWLILSGLMCFFLVGYLGYIGLQLLELAFPMELLIGCIFLGGAIFVLIVINLSKSTIHQLNDFNIKLEDSIEERTSELLNSNKDLQKAKDQIYEEKLRVEEANLEIRNLIKKSNESLNVRFENPNLLKCWEVKNCKTVSCPAYRSDDLRCWQVIGTKCNKFSKDNTQITVENCEKCSVYKHVIDDPITSIGEQFNILMDTLDYKVYLLEKERQRAEKASAGKSEFLANMSHEIRTPMNAIIGFTNLMLKMEIPSDQRKYLTLVRSSGYRLLDIINNILDFSKIESGNIKLSEKPFSPQILMKECMDILAIKAQEKNLDFSYSIKPDHPIQLIGDEGKIRQILVNLVGNAIKFTEKGGIVVSVWVGDYNGSGQKNSEEESIHFSVQDTGIGIPIDQQKEIFESFTQADGSSTRSFGGTGLGLSISAQLARLMKGDLWVESKPDEGSTFHFLARVKKGKQNETIETASDMGEGNYSATINKDKVAEKSKGKVLVVDDEAINRTLAVAVLEEIGYEVAEAENGEQAIELSEKDSFEVVLMDIQMPKMDGMEATLALRQKEKATNRHLPIIAMTAHAIHGDKEKFLSAGMDAYISKPFDAKELYDLIEKLIS